MNDILSKILEASKHIHSSSLRGSGSYIMVGSKIGTSLNEIFKRSTRNEKIKSILKGIENG